MPRKLGVCLVQISYHTSKAGQLTQVDYMGDPPRLLDELQRLCGQVLLHNCFVHAPQQLLRLALVHRGYVLVPPDAHNAHDVRCLRDIK